MIALITKLVNGITRIISAADAIQDIPQTWSNKELSTREKITRCFSNGLFLLAEGSSFRAWWKGFSPSLQLRREAVAAVTDVGRRGIRLAYQSDSTQNDVIDLIGFTALRASGVINRGVLLQLAAFQNAESLAEGLGAAGNLILARDVLARAPARAWKAIQTVTAYFQGKNLPLPELRLRRDEAPELRINPRFTNAFLEVRNAPNIQAFNRIPEILHSDPILLERQCPITKEPIRYLLVIVGTEPPICYEREAILQCLSSRKPPPPSWPRETPFIRENLKECPHLQEKIDACLQQNLEGFQELNVSEMGEDPIDIPLLEPSFQNLIESFGIHDFSIDDSRIKEKIARTIPRDTYSSISVVTLPSYKFPNEDVPQKARQITLKIRPCDNFSHIRYTISSRSSSIDLSRTISAIFGSEDPEDGRHLLTAYRHNLTLHIYVSADLKIHFESLETKQMCVIL